MPRINFDFLIHAEVEGIYVITSGVPDEPKVTELTPLFIFVISTITLPPQAVTRVNL